jgi:hypothetical protein
MEANSPSFDGGSIPAGGRSTPRALNRRMHGKIGKEDVRSATLLGGGVLTCELL